MSKYTTELRFICENAAGLTESEGYNNINTILDAARPVIFDFDFPIFDENYRNVLENKILKHFYTREIGVETVGLWKLRLDTKMNEIMPYYNQLYNSALLEFNPLYDVDLTTDHQKVDNGTHSDNENLSETTAKSGTVDVTETKTMQGETTDTNTSELYGEKSGNENSTITEDNSISNSSNQSVADSTIHDKWDMYSDTPQGGLNGVRSEEYLTNARHTTDSTNGSTTTTTITGSSDEDKSKNSEITNTENIHNTSTDNGHGTSSEVNNNTMNNEYSEDTSKTNLNTKSGTIKNIQDYLEHVKGKSAGSSYSKMLMEFRKTFLNIDMMVIDELNELFMLIW